MNKCYYIHFTLAGKGAVSWTVLELSRACTNTSMGFKEKCNLKRNDWCLLFCASFYVQ